MSYRNPTENDAPKYSQNINVAECAQDLGHSGNLWLIVQTSLLEALSLLLSKIHVRRGQEIDLVGYFFHFATKRITETADEIDDSSCKISVCGL